MSDLLSVAEAVKYIRLSESSLSRMRKNNTGPKFVQMGTRVYYRKADLDAYVESQLVQTTIGE